MKTLMLENDQLAVTIALVGAEIRAITNRSSGHQYMWSGDSHIWSGVSPILFPVVGQTIGVVRYNGKSYPLGNHGFARHSEFQVTQHTPTAVSLELTTNTSVATCYPFNLCLQVTYSLEGHQLIMAYQVTNLDGISAYFSLGAHPAFACPFANAQQLSNYYLEFAQEEILTQWELTPEALLSGKQQQLALHRIELSAHIFDQGALMFSGMQSNSIALRENGSNRQIKVSLAGFPLLGVWSKPGANFVCIEPWCGHSDNVDFSGEVNRKPAIEVVNANSSWHREISLEFCY
jgi:galactose mutarotase-like enzyme